MPAVVIDQAIAWAVKIDFNAPDTATQSAFDAWLSADLLHATAWHRIQSLKHDFANLPPKLALDTLQAAEAKLIANGVSRRQMLKLLSIAGVIGAAGWIAREQTPWQRLSDGTRLVLNTDTAVSIKLAGEQRVIVLRRGEMLATTGPDLGLPSRRPFWVDTSFGRMQALGTRFAVRLDGDDARVTVQEGTVEMHTASTGRSAIARPGESWRLGADRLTRMSQSALDPMSWTDSVIKARQMRLADLLAELSRYRRGRIFCDPAVADLPVSGIYQVDDTDRTLAFLAQTLRLRIDYRTRFWVTVGPADI
jgi:transmembrane sensor